MAGIAHDLLDQGYPFLMEKPMGINASEVEGVAAKAAQLHAFVAVPLAQRYTPFATRARELLALGRFGPLSHIYVRINRPGPARYQTWDCAWMLDPAEAGGGCLRNLGPHGLDMFLHLTGEEAQVTSAQLLTPGAFNYWKSHNFMALSDGLFDTLVNYVRTLPTAECEIFIGQLGGATGRVPADATAYPHRDANFVMNVHTRWRERGDERAAIKWARELFAATAPHATGGVYVNFMPEDETDRVAGAVDRASRLNHARGRQMSWHNLFLSSWC
jgi:predicted dehydrogenase